LCCKIPEFFGQAALAFLLSSKNVSTVCPKIPEFYDTTSELKSGYIKISLFCPEIPEFYDTTSELKRGYIKISFVLSENSGILRHNIRLEKRVIK
jgi:hypothetical protein